MTKRILKKDINQLKKDVFSDDWKFAKSAAKKLVKIGGDEIVDFFISLLSLDNHSIIRMAAWALDEIRDNKAVNPLLRSIFKKENYNYNASMVWTLSKLDCSNKLKEIFKILFYQAYEAKLYAHGILNEQIFTFSHEDILKIKKMWDDIKLNPKKCPGYDDEQTREMMQDGVDGFMGYLKEKEIKTKSNSRTKKSPAGNSGSKR